jgi:hypothetical protein
VRSLFRRRPEAICGSRLGPTIGFVIDELRVAVEALNQGDVEPFLALLDEDSEWRGLTTGHLWWKQAPS